MPDIYFADEIKPINPFSLDGKYGDDWVELSITNSAKYKEMTCKDFLFCFKISKLRNENWQFRAMDYVEYNLFLGRNVIFSGDREDFEKAKAGYSGHSIHDPFLRSYEPVVLVHSTTPDGYLNIIEDGALKSWNVIQKECNNIGQKPIGDLLGDPVDFRDYIMLGGLGFWNEIVVSSKQKGYICMDADCDYMPGARFYFSTLTLIQDGLLIRDGAHYKVKDILPLSYVLFCATTDNVAVNSTPTPKIFSTAADEAFERFCDKHTDGFY